MLTTAFPTDEATCCMGPQVTLHPHMTNLGVLSYALCHRAFNVQP
jgi:hypothetical protein